MEIERKFLIKSLPDLGDYPKKHIEQAYLCTDPAIRVRDTDGRYSLTVKGKGFMAREELNLPLSPEAYASLRQKAEGLVIRKTRHLIPCGPYTIELDVFEDDLALLIVAEVEFPTEDEANAFTPPAWFGEEVTYDRRYSNAQMTRGENGAILGR